MSLLDDLKAEMIESGEASKDLFDYIDDRIEAIVNDRLSICLGDVEERLQADIEYKWRNR